VGVVLRAAPLCCEAAEDDARENQVGNGTSASWRRRCASQATRSWTPGSSTAASRAPRRQFA